MLSNGTSALAKRRRVVIWVIASKLLCCTVACKDSADNPPAASVAVQAAHPEIGPIAEEIAADAILAPLAQAALSPKISAPIRRLYVQRGSHVQAGQLLVTLEDRDLRGSAIDSRGALLQAQAAYDAATRATIPEDVQKAQLDVDQAKVNLQVADRTATERKRLLREGAIAGRDTDAAIAAAVQARAAYDIAVKHLSSVQQITRGTNTQSAQGQLVSAQGRQAGADAQVSYANLRSPISGVVTDRPYFAGETAPVGSAVVTVMDTSSLLAKLHLAQSAAQKLHVGNEAKILVPGVTGPVVAALSFISPALDPGSTTVEVWLKLPNTDGRFKVGTPVHALIRGETADRALQVPPSALLADEGGGHSVMVVGPDGTAHKRSVSLGIETPEATQILKGLAVSDLVITEGSYGLDDGTKVEVSKGKPESEGRS